MTSNIKNNDDCSDKLSSLQSEIKRLSSKLAEKEKLFSQYKCSEYYFQTLFEKTNEAYCISDCSGNILKINQNAANLLDYTPAEIPNKSFSDLRLKTWKIGKPGKSFLKKVIQQNAPSKEEFILRKGNGNKIIIKMSFHPYQSEEGLLQLIHLKDLSGDKMINGDEKKQKAFLERLVKERTTNLLSTNSQLQKEA